MPENNNTIDAYLNSFEADALGNFNAQEAVQAIREAVEHITVNGEYDANIVIDRVGEYIHAILQCGKMLASLGLVRDFQKTEVDKEFANAALIRAPEKGYLTDGKAKLYAQMDEQYVEARQKFDTIEATIDYIDNFKTSLYLAQLHCKKILDRDKADRSFGGDYERFSNGNGQTTKWIKE